MTYQLRAHDRYALDPAYTMVTVQRFEDGRLATVEGHAYDLSPGGIRFELDEPLEVGERVAFCLQLPGETTSIFVSGRVVWTHDEEDDPGPRRMGAVFTRFLAGEDRSRLLRYLNGGGTGRLAA